MGYPAAGQTPKMLSELRTAWAPEAFVVSFKLETDAQLLSQKVRAEWLLPGGRDVCCSICMKGACSVCGLPDAPLRLALRAWQITAPVFGKSSKGFGVGNPRLCHHQLRPAVWS